MALVSLEIDGDLAIITLDNPPVNAVSLQMIAEFHNVIDDLLASLARAVFTRSNHPVFSAGADVRVFVDKEFTQARRELADGIELLQRFEALPMPTIAQIDGMCVAAGCEFMLMHDLAYASTRSQIGQVEAMIGTSTLLGGVQRLAARCGSARAAEMVFSGLPYPAERMAEWNVINGVYEADVLTEKVERRARKLASGPTQAHVVTKAALRAFRKGGMATADDVMLEAAPRLLQTNDMKAGVQAFLDEGVASFGKTPFEGR